MRPQVDLQSTSSRIRQHVFKLIEQEIAQCRECLMLRNSSDGALDKRPGNYSLEDVKHLQLLCNTLSKDQNFLKFAVVEWSQIERELRNVFTTTAIATKLQNDIVDALKILTDVQKSGPGKNVLIEGDKPSALQQLAISLGLYALCDLCEYGCHRVSDGRYYFKCERFDDAMRCQTCNKFVPETAVRSA